MASITSSSTNTNLAGVQRTTWSLTTAGDTGVAISLANYPDKTVQVTGTFGSVTLRGSNLATPSDATAADWFNLSDPQGSDLTFTAAGGATLSENPLWISPICTGGSAYTVTIVSAL